MEIVLNTMHVRVLVTGGHEFGQYAAALGLKKTGVDCDKHVE